MGQQWSDGYSADIEIYLLIGEVKHAVAQVVENILMLRKPCSIPPETFGTLVIKVDGHEERDEIFFQSGAESSQEVVPFI